MYNKTINESAFSINLIDAVWNKGIAVIGYDAKIWRKDTCGAWMKRSEYGNVNSLYGWEIDHINPKANGGKDNIENLQPLQWQNNRHKGDNYPYWSCKIKAAA